HRQARPATLLGVLAGSLLALAGVSTADQELTPEKRQELQRQAQQLNAQGGQRYQQRRYAEATKVLQQALEIRKRLYPKAQYAQGHPLLALSLNDLGHLLKDQGEYGRALPYYQQALAMYQRLYPQAQYPQGHPHLAISLNNLGMLLWAQGEHG